MKGNLFGGIRPCDVNTSIQLLITRPDDFSFPSGHTAALVVLAVWIINYKIPQEGIKAAAFPQIEAGTDSGKDAASGQENQPDTQPGSFMATNVVMDTQDWHEKFADKFTDTVVATDTSYTSPDLSIQRQTWKLAY